MILTTLPVVVALALIWLTSRQVSRARSELAELVDSTAFLHDEIGARLETLDAARQAADSLSAQLRAYEEWVARRSERAADSISATAAQQFDAGSVTPRIYIHIVEESQRQAAKAIQQKLEQAGFEVPGIERVSAGPRRSELRYFKSDDRDGAERIRQVVDDQGTALDVRDLTAAYGASTRPGHYEIWFGSAFGGPP